LNQVLLIAIFFACGLVLVFLVSRITLAILRRVMRREVAERTRGQRVVRQALTANFFGLQSLGRGQIRGNGALVLTTGELIFIMTFPRRVTEIPLDGITEVSLARRFLGKRAWRPLLQVDFTGTEGPDAAAWAVADPEGWRQALAAVAGGGSGS